MNRTYECMVLLDNREVRQGWDAMKSNVSGMLTKHGADVISSRLWEERRLAYPIKHQERGTYLLVYFAAPTANVALINRELRMAEPVLRHVVTACDDVPESAHAPERDFDVSKIGLDQEPVPPAAAPDAVEVDDPEVEDVPVDLEDVEDSEEEDE